MEPFSDNKYSWEAEERNLDEILKRLEKLIPMANSLVIERPEFPNRQGLVDVLKYAKEEIPLIFKKYEKISQIGYSVTRIYQENIDLEGTPFGEEMGYLLLAIIDHQKHLENMNIARNN